MLKNTSTIKPVPFLIDAMKRLMDGGQEILVLKHIYDLTNQEVEEILDLYEIEDMT